MIAGFGTDIAEVERMAQKLERNPDLSNHIFCEVEQNYCNAQAYPARSYAARFAAKEAFLKAFGVTFIGNHRLTEIQVQNDEHGKPFLILLGQTKLKFDELGFCAIHLSMSHTARYATASVILEK